MNILQVTLGFLPAEAWGGPVKIVYRNAKELLSRGHQVTIYCTNLFDKKRKLQPYTFEQVIDGIRVVYFDTWHISFWPGTLGPIWLPELKTYIRREIYSFDVIHLNGYRNLMDVQLVDAIQHADIPLVIQPHGAMPVIVNSFLVKRLYDRLFGSRELQRAQAFIALHQKEKHQIAAHGVPAEKIAVIANGLDVHQRFESIQRGDFRKRYGVPADKKLILFLGRINRKKGTDMLVQAFAKLQDSSAYLAIVGPDDGQLLEVEELIRQNDLSERTILPGLLSGPRVLEAYRDADVFVLPCRTDTFPTTIMEACLAGVPMVITDRCEIADLVKDRVAEVVPFDSSAFAEGMRRILSDTGLCQKYKSNCSKVMQDTFSIKQTADKLERLYQRLINGT